MFRLGGISSPPDYHQAQALAATIRSLARAARRPACALSNGLARAQGLGHCAWLGPASGPHLQANLHLFKGVSDLEKPGGRG